MSSRTGKIYASRRYMFIMKLITEYYKLLNKLSLLAITILDVYMLRLLKLQMLKVAENIEANCNTYCLEDLARRIVTQALFTNLGLRLQLTSAAILNGAAELAAPSPPLHAAPRRPLTQLQQQPTAPVSKPIDTAKLENLNEDAAILSKVEQIITNECEKGPLSYFHCVLDPESFSRSVRNIYYVSSLVQTGVVTVVMDSEHGIPMIHSTPSEERAEQRDDSKQNLFIVSIDMHRWRLLVDACVITSPMLKYI